MLSEAKGCDAIFAYYYEPYAVAAALVAHWTGRPLIVKHAGSDLDRLFRVPDLATTYKEILRSADVVVTQRPLMSRFRGMGIRDHSLCADVRFALPNEFFRPDGQALDIERLAIRDFAEAAVSEGIVSPPFDSRVFSIGVYGKTGIAKGTYDLVAALGNLAKDGLRFNFVAMIGEVQAARLMPTLKAAGLLHHTYILPFLPSWKVPAFIRTCDTVCFLERDFPVTIHGPIVPREILACGTCLVLSGEIAKKQIDADEFVPGRNFVMVKDPQDHDELTEQLSSLIVDPKAAAEIGSLGSQLSRPREDYNEFIDGWERIFNLPTRGKRGSPELISSTFKPAVTTDPLLHFAPILRSTLENCVPALLEEFHQHLSATDPVHAGLQLCDFLNSRFSSTEFAPNAAQLRDALKYQRARLESAFDVDDNVPTFTVTDQLQGNAVTALSVAHLRPLRGHFVRIVEFNFDVTPLFAYDPLPTDLRVNDLSNLEEEPMLVLFQRTANLQPKELKINEATRQLIARCDGSQLTSALVPAFCKDLGNNSSEDRQRVFSALETLYRENVIVFGERKIGWGWTGGPRWTPGGAL